MILLTSVMLLLSFMAMLESKTVQIQIEFEDMIKMFNSLKNFGSVKKIPTIYAPNLVYKNPYHPEDDQENIKSQRPDLELDRLDVEKENLNFGVKKQMDDDEIASDVDMDVIKLENEELAKLVASVSNEDNKAKHVVYANPYHPEDVSNPFMTYIQQNGRPASNLKYLQFKPVNESVREDANVNVVYSNNNNSQSLHVLNSEQPKLEGIKDEIYKLDNFTTNIDEKTLKFEPNNEKPSKSKNNKKLRILNSNQKKSEAMKESKRLDAIIEKDNLNFINGGELNDDELTDIASEVNKMQKNVKSIYDQLPPAAKAYKSEIQQQNEINGYEALQKRYVLKSS